jgi:hypothetical protein
MATTRVGSTAFGAAAMKALESHTAPALRLFDDEERYLRPRGRVMAVFDLERVAIAFKE